MDLPDPQARDNAEIDQLWIESLLTASEFHKKHQVSNQGLKKECSITWQQA